MAHVRLTTAEGKTQVYGLSGSQVRGLEQIFEHLHRFPDHGETVTFFFEVEVLTDRGPVRAAFEPAYRELRSWSFGHEAVDDLLVTDQQVSEEYARMFHQILDGQPVSMKVILMQPMD